MKHTLILFILSFLSFQINAQCISGDCKNGRGTYKYPSGAKYTGDFKNGEIHGVGICYYTDGSKYSGEWNSRYPNGKGTKTYSNGTKRTGQWAKGLPVDEKGIVIEDYLASKGEENNDGTDIQSGCIDGDCENGEGVFAYSDGSKYEGQFRAGKLDGQGSWFFPDGKKYVGSFKNNLPHGKGTVYANGKETSGVWKAGEYVSDGKAAKEGCINGNCKNGKGTYVYKNGGAKYIGTFKNGLADGKGTCIYANGEKYEGAWANGSFNGVGTLILKNGTRVQGNWLKGTYQGRAKPSAPNKIVVDDTDEMDMTPPESADNVDESKPMVNPEIASKKPTNMKVWAVVIGVASYSHMPVLRYTDDDAYRMYAFLKSPEGGALSDDQVKILIDEDATKQKIINTMLDVFTQAGPNDLVMLYFSGHGLKGSFLPIDFDGFNNKLFHDEVNSILKQSAAKYKLCIADACHSGSLLAMRGSNVENALTKYYKTLAQAQAGTALIMSSKSDETSLESSGLRQGVFSHFLIRGLKGEADVNKDEVVSVQELYQYINGNVRDYTGMRQSPVIKGDYDENMTVGVVRKK